MSPPTAYRLTQGLYYLALGTWFGAQVMLVIAAIKIFATVRGYGLILTDEPYITPALQAQSADILAGGIVGNMLLGLAVLEVICAGVAAMCLAAQCTLFADRLAGRGRAGQANLARLLLIAGPVVVLLLNLLWIGPAVREQRTLMYSSDQPQAVRQQARQTFDHYHQLSERTHGAAVLMLGAAVLVSPFAFSVGRPRHLGRASQR